MGKGRKLGGARRRPKEWLARRLSQTIPRAPREAAVIALPDEELGMKVRAHLATRDGTRLSLIKLKAFCAQHLPVYMIPDVFSFHAELPKTSTEKTDYQTLMKME